VKQTRMLVVAAPGVIEDLSGHRRGKWAPLVDELEQHYAVTGVVQPRTAHLRYVAAATRRLGIGERALARSGRWTAEVGELMKQFPAGYDFLLQFQTLFACGADYARRRYVIYTDNTLALTLRHYPQWWSASAEENAAYLEFEARVARSAEAVCTLSEWARSSMLEDYGCDPARVFAVGGGANPIRAPLSTGDGQVALFVGVDFQRKGGEVLLAAWQQVRRRLPSSELWIVGPRRRRHSTNGVRWLGRQPHEEIKGLCARATVFVLPSLFEPWGFAFNEAMASGLPCVGTTACAMPEIIEDGVSGRLVEPGDADELAEALVDILGDPVHAARMGRAALDAFNRRGTWESVAARVAAVADGILARPPLNDPSSRGSP
jgi:glycosyltransferase involved in cell wall biosynthesis